MTSAVELENAARAAAARGDREGAAAHWAALLEKHPDHGPALNAVGNFKLANGDAAAARLLFRRAVEADPGQIALLFNLAAAERAAGDHLAAIRALDAALAIDPYFVQAIFQKAVLLEEQGSMRDAALIYRDFLDTAPPEVLENPRFAAILLRARECVAQDNAALGALIERGAAAPSLRGREAIDALVGKQRIYVAEPTFLTIPRLPAIPFFDRADTPWIGVLEAATDDIRREAEAVLADSGRDPFEPYVANPPGIPANQWGELDHSKRWGAFFLWKHGVRDEDNCARCPATSAILDRLPLVQLRGRMPNAFFSLLEPKTRIPPHTGVTNARSTAHLPLIVPEGCGFRVGAETREWRPGAAWVFDDTIEHEAWNDSDQPRLILIFDVWNPLLDPAEHGFLAEALDAYDHHYGRTQGMSDTL